MPQNQQSSDNISDKQYASYRLLGDGRSALAIVNPDGSSITPGSGTTTANGTVGAAVPTIANQSGFKDASGNLAPGNLDVSGNLKVAGSFSAAAIVDGTASGTLGALNANVLIVLAGYYGVGVTLPAGLTGTVQAFLSFDGGVTYPQQTQFYSTNGTYVSNVINPSGAYGIVVTGGSTHAKVIVSAYTSGSITATLKATYASTPDILQVAVNNLPTTQAVSGTVTAVNSVANNNWAQALATTAGATATIISIASSVAGYQIKGLVAHGTGDGYFFIQINSVTVLSGRTRSTLPTIVLTLPNGIPVTTASAVVLKVTNESGSTADYEATLLGA